MQDSTVVARSVAQTLDVLAQKFGATGAHLWQVLIRQVYIDAITNAVVMVVLIAGATLFVRKAFALYRTDADEFPFFAVIAGVFTLAAVVTTLVGLQYVLQVLNPEYGALTTILGALHK